LPQQETLNIVKADIQNPLAPLGRQNHDPLAIRQEWQSRWSDDDFDAPWMGRGVSPEIAEAVADGWFPPGSTILDIGCGDGAMAAWMAERGFPTVGVDIAPAAVARAKSRYFGLAGRLESFVVEVCQQAPPDRQYRMLIDCGCFHTISPADYPRLSRNLLQLSAPDARLLLLHRAYRDGIPMGDPEERRRVTSMVTFGLRASFQVVRSADTCLDPFDGQRPDQIMGGIAFWLERKST